MLKEHADKASSKRPPHALLSSDSENEVSAENIATEMKNPILSADPSRLTMIRATRANTNYSTLIFAEDCETGYRYCQFYDRNTKAACNFAIKLDKEQMKNRGARDCNRHVTQKHKVNITETNYQDFLDPLSQIFQEESQEKLSTAFFLSKKEKASMKMFDELVATMHTAGVPFSFLDCNDTKRWLQKYVLGYEPSMDGGRFNERSLVIANTILSFFQREFRDFAKKHLSTQRIVLMPYDKEALEYRIFQRFVALKNIPLPFVGLESDDWTVNEHSHASFTASIMTPNLKPIRISLRWVKSTHHDLVIHNSHFAYVASMLGVEHLLISTCSKNCFYKADSIKMFDDSPRYTLLEGHVECIAHHLSLITHEAIKDILDEFGYTDKDLEIYDNEFDTASNIRKNVSKQEDCEKRFSELSKRLCDPFQDKVPNVCIRITRFIQELEHSPKKLQIFLQYSPEQLRMHGLMELDEISCLIQKFLNLSPFIFKFIKNAPAHGIIIKNKLSEDDVTVSQLLVSILKPYEELILLISRDEFASHSYLPILILMKEHLIECRAKLGSMEIAVTFDRALSKCVTIIDRIDRYFPVIRWCSFFNPEYLSKTFNTEESYEMLLDELVNISLKLLRFEFIDRDLPGTKAKVEWSNASHLCKLKKRKLDSLSGMDTPGVSEKFEKLLRKMIDKDIMKFLSFSDVHYPEIRTSALGKENIEAKIVNGTIVYQKELLVGSQDFGYRPVSELDIFHLTVQAVSILLKKFLKEDNETVIIPIVLEVLLSISVSSINSERPASTLDSAGREKEILFSDDTINASLIIKSFREYFDVEIGSNPVPFGIQDLLEKTKK